MRLLLVLAVMATAAAGCSTSDEGENLACSWSGSADAGDDSAAHICSTDEGEVRAFNFKSGSTITLELPGGEKRLTVGQDGTAQARVPTGLGIVKVSGTKNDGTSFENGLTILPSGE